MSAVGFATGQLWLARCAVALPFALATAQLLFPGDAPLREIEPVGLLKPQTLNPKP